MDIRCPSCSKLFRVADEKIAGKGIRFKCSKCAEVITVTKDDFEMDLLARDADVLEAPPRPAAQPVPAPPAQKPVPPPAPGREPEAREYKPPVEQPSDEQEIPPASLSDFDFSEPHAAAIAAAHPAEGFGGTGFSFDADTDQDAAPEIEISPEAAAEAEAALQFPDDLISEPKRKPAFGSTSPEEQAPEIEPAAETQEPDLGAALAMPKGPVEETGSVETDQDFDLGAALAMPKVPVEDTTSAADDRGPDSGAAPATPKGPVITPELLAQMKRNAPAKSAAQAKAAPLIDEDIDLGAALAMPKTKGTAGKGESVAASKISAETRDAEAPLSGKRTLVIGVIAAALVAVLAVLYYLGFLWGKNEQEAQQVPQPKAQTKVQPARQEITPDGLTIVDPVAIVDPKRGDLVITGTIHNTLDKPKAGWYLVTEVRDAKEAVLTTVKMVNGVQLYTDKDRELLAKRGAKAEDVRSALQKGSIPARGSVSFEIRVLNPPAGSAGFLPALRSVDPATLGEGK